MPQGSEAAAIQGVAYVIKGSNNHRVPIKEIPALLAMHEGYSVELKIYDDQDPDVQFRMAEALKGLNGTFTKSHTESIYVERLRHVLECAPPKTEYKV